MSTDTIIKTAFVVMFLLFAYFMIGGYTPCINKKIGNYSELYDQITNRNPNNTAKYAESKLALVGSPVPSFYDFNNMNLYQKRALFGLICVLY